MVWHLTTLSTVPSLRFVNRSFSLRPLPPHSLPIPSESTHVPACGALYLIPPHVRAEHERHENERNKKAGYKRMQDN